MIVVELMYFTFSQGTWGHVESWLQTMYIGYSEKTPRPIYHVERLNDKLTYNKTIIARSRVREAAKPKIDHSVCRPLS